EIGLGATLRCLARADPRMRRPVLGEVNRRHVVVLDDPDVRHGADRPAGAAQPGAAAVLYRLDRARRPVRRHRRSRDAHLLALPPGDSRGTQAMQTLRRRVAVKCTAAATPTISTHAGWRAMRPRWLDSENRAAVGRGVRAFPTAARGLKNQPRAADQVAAQLTLTERAWQTGWQCGGRALRFPMTSVPTHLGPKCDHFAEILPLPTNIMQLLRRALAIVACVSILASAHRILAESEKRR